MVFVCVSRTHFSEIRAIIKKLEEMAFVRKAEPTDSLPTTVLPVRLPQEPLFWTSEFMVLPHNAHTHTHSLTYIFIENSTLV